MFNRKKFEILPLIYTNQDSKSFSISNIKTPKCNKNGLTLQFNTNSTTRHVKSRWYSVRFDKYGDMQYLDKLTSSEKPKGMVRSLSGSNFSLHGSTMRDMKLRSGEVNRQIRKATATLQLKKYSDIVNYNQTDNKVLQKQMKIIKKWVENKSKK